MTKHFEINQKIPVLRGIVKMTVESKKIVGKECRFAVHIPSKHYEVPDLHLVKEVLHYEDGSTEPNIKFIKDFKRSFGVTKEAYRTHKQKKESERIENLVIHSCTQSQLTRKVAGALGNPHDPRPLNKLSESPYLYGSDISSTSIIKAQYARQYPTFNTPYTVAHLDIETNVLDGTNDPIMITVVYGKKVFFGLDQSFVSGYSNIEARYRACVAKYIQEYVDKHSFEIEFFLAKDCIEMLKVCFDRLHVWNPDFVAVWNISFDVKRMLETFEKYGVDPGQVMASPKLPEKFRFAKFREGSTKKITASGQVKPKKPSEQWHSLICPSGFWFIDQMSSYRFIRQGSQEKQEYSLDFILEEELGIRKLKFEEANGYHKLEWHKFMQKNYPFEYMVYNNFDSISCHELELKLRDLSLSVPIRANISDFTRFDSQTKRFADKYHFFLIDKFGEMVGTIPPAAKEGGEEADFIGLFDDEDDDEVYGSDGGENLEGSLQDVLDNKDVVLSLKNWIVTLKSHMSVLGLNLVLESETMETLLRAFVYDSDAVSAYPTCTAVGNVSRETTLCEIIDIVGVDEDIFRQMNINLLQGHVNAAEYCTHMLSMPRLEDSLALFDDM